MNKSKFSKSFLWGAASAAYQVEGAFDTNGKGQSIWDVYSHLEGTTYMGTNGDVAVDHFHRYKEDVQLMKEQGLKSYRFSISWPRVMPTGKGEVNEEGLKFYSDLIDELIANNVVPFVTLYHWDLPQALEDEGGWLNRDTAKHFTKYAEVMFKALGDRVKHWITFNEMVVFCELGYKLGIHPPGQRDELKALTAENNVFVAHAKSVLLYKELVNKKSIIAGEIGITHVITPVYAASDDPKDLRGCNIAEGQRFNWFYDPVLKGDYPNDTYEMYHRDNGFTKHEEDIKLFKKAAPLNDFIGINYYQSSMVAHNDTNVGFQGMNTTGESGSQKENGEIGRWKSVRNPSLEHTAWDWAIHPEGLADGMRRIKDRYGDIPIYITENGLGAVDEIMPDGSINDMHRIDYVQKHLQACNNVLAEGIQLKGYFMWSFTDLLSWLNGYKKQYGFVYVDHENDLKRVKKASYFWYEKVIATDGESLFE